MKGMASLALRFFYTVINCEGGEVLDFLNMYLLEYFTSHHSNKNLFT